MNNLFQNGPKQINLDGGVTNTNAFKQMIDNMTMNQANMNERLEQIGNRPSTYNDVRLENAFNNMNLNNQINIPNFQINENQNFANFENSWNNNILKQNLNNSSLIDLNIQQQFNFSNNLGMKQNFLMGMGAPQIHPMLLELNKNLENQNKNALINKANENKTDESLNKETTKNNNENPNDIFKDIIDVMENQDDERHKNSEFLKFIKKLQTGEIKLNEKENDIEDNKLSVENQLMNSNNNIDEEKNLEEMWNKLEANLHDIDYNLEYGQDQKDRLFLSDNKFVQEHNNENIDLLNLAKEYIAKNDSVNARLVLEAEINKNPDHAEAWVILGKIHTENDRDDLAMQCFLKAIEADPFNGEALLALGISCTNEFDEFDAMVYIANWIKLHAVYNKFYDKANPVLNYDMVRFEMENDRPDEDYYAKAIRIQNLKNNFYNEMTMIMENINANGISLNQNKDLDLLIAMGISNFIQNKNDKAIENFRNAVIHFPNDYTAWNKLGAILAHSNMNEEAINTYKKALSLKPNYARCWSNIGLAYFNLKNYDEAIRCFLTSLKCYKDINHVWSYLNSVLIASDKSNLSELVYNRNLEELLRLFKFQ